MLIRLEFDDNQVSVISIILGKSNILRIPSNSEILFLSDQIFTCTIQLENEVVFMDVKSIYAQSLTKLFTAESKPAYIQQNEISIQI